jgi:hypothetical protein
MGMSVDDELQPITVRILYSQTVVTYDTNCITPVYYKY